MVFRQYPLKKLQLQEGQIMGVLKGVVVPTITPLKKGSQDRIDQIAVGKLCDFLISKNVHGLFPCGTTGEGFLLSKEARKDLASMVVEKVEGRAAVVIQTGCIDTKSTIELTRHARDIGADGAAVVTPYYYGHKFGELKEHFVSVARSVPELPIYLYAIPDCANNDITARLLAEVIDETDNIAGIKYTHFDLTRVFEYCKYLGENRAFLIGNDRLIYPSLALGASGCVSSTANYFPEPFVRLYNAFLNGDHLAAKKQQDLIAKTISALENVAGIACCKTALQFRGINVGDVIPPLNSLDKEEKLALCRQLKDLGLPLENPIC